jgi:hypothetical protein
MNDVCANCGEVYDHHMRTTQCYPDSTTQWFPAQLAEAILKSQMPTNCPTCGEERVMNSTQFLKTHAWKVQFRCGHVFESERCK